MLESRASLPPRPKAAAGPAEARAIAIAATLSYVTLLGGLICIAAALALIVRSHARTPVWDMWSMVDFWAKPTQSKFRWLWAQHNEHRILVGKVILLLDYTYLHGRDIFPVAAGFGSQLASFAVLLWAFRRLGRMPAMVWRSAAGSAALCLFTTAQWPNFVNGFQIHFFLVGLFFIVAVVAILHSVPKRDEGGIARWGYPGIAVVAGTAATYSLANGILVWPILTLLGILRRSNKAVIAFLVVCGIAASGSYVYRYTTPVSRVKPFRWVYHPLSVAAYIIRYVGAPVDWNHLTLAFLFGLVGLLLAALVIWRTLVSPHHDALMLLLASLLLFVAGSATITAVGRLQFGVNQALSMRYQTVALLLWLSLLVIAIVLVAQRSVRLLIVVQIGVIAVMCMGAFRLKSDLAAAQERKVRANTASLALMTGVFDEEELRILFPDAAIPWRDIPFLKQNQLSLFSTRLARELHQPLAAAYRIRSEPCWGEVTDRETITNPAGPGLRVTGWAWDPFQQRPVGQVVFADEGTIVGYGEVGFPRPDLAPAFNSHSAANAGWEGYIEAVRRPGTVVVFAATASRRHEVCAVVGRSANSKAGRERQLSFSVKPVNN